MFTLPELAGRAGISLNLRLAANGERGPEYQGPCPTCGGDDRFHVWPEQHSDRGGSYWCRQCGVCGDGIQFLRDFGKLSFKDACRIVGKDISGPAASSFRRPWKSTPMPPKNPVSRQTAALQLKPRECEEPGEKWQNQARKYVDQGREALVSNPAALEKLERERGITKATAERFNLGLLLPRPGDRLPCRFSSRKLWDLPPKKGAKNPDSFWLPRGLIIPALISATDNALTSAPNNKPGVLRLRIRRPAADINNGGSKYYIVPGSGMAPLQIHDQQPALVVVESELDAILIYQEASSLVGVLALGNSSARPDHATATILDKIPLVILAFDNDAAGDQAADRWQAWYNHCERLTLPTGIKDPGELHHSGGNLYAWIGAALPSPWRTPPPSTPISTVFRTITATKATTGPENATSAPGSVIGGANNEAPPIENQPPTAAGTTPPIEVDGWKYKPLKNLSITTF